MVWTREYLAPPFMEVTDASARRIPGGPTVAGACAPAPSAAGSAAAVPVIATRAMGRRARRFDRENVALSYVYANSGCVAASWLCVL